MPCASANQTVVGTASPDERNVESTTNCSSCSAANALLISGASDVVIAMLDPHAFKGMHAPHNAAVNVQCLRLRMKPQPGSRSLLDQSLSSRASNAALPIPFDKPSRLRKISLS